MTAVVLLHGCDGTLDEHGQLYRKRLRVAELVNVEKMHVLVLDSFTPRGIRSICTIPYSKRIIEYEDRRDDVFAAMRWLSRQPIVDQGRIALLGYSHGAGVVLSAFDRTGKAVQAQPLQPKAGVAFYPRCEPFAQMGSYEVVAPLLVMIGELDDVLPADQCVRLHGKVKRTRPDAAFDLIVFPGSHHGFDGNGPVRVMPSYSTRAGKGTVGGNPEARAKSHQRMFDFLSAQLGSPLALTHDERLFGHRSPPPPTSGFARGDDVSAVPSRTEPSCERPTPTCPESGSGTWTRGAAVLLSSSCMQPRAAAASGSISSRRSRAPDVASWRPTGEGGAGR